MHLRARSPLLLLLLISLLPLSALAHLDNPPAPPAPKPIPSAHPRLRLKLFRYNHDRCMGSIDSVLGGDQSDEPGGDQSHAPIVIEEGRCYASTGRGEEFSSFLIGFMPPLQDNGTVVAGFEKFTDFGDCVMSVAVREDCAEGDPAAQGWRGKRRKTILKHGNDKHMVAKLHGMQTAIGCQRQWDLFGGVARGIRVDCTGRKKDAKQRAMWEAGLR
nr:hypothetical protein CFP56_42162 [Quercus suber]